MKTTKQTRHVTLGDDLGIVVTLSGNGIPERVTLAADGGVSATIDAEVISRIAAALARLHPDGWRTCCPDHGLSKGDGYRCEECEPVRVEPGDTAGKEMIS